MEAQDFEAFEEALRRRALGIAARPLAPACAEGLATARCIRLRELLEAAPCAESAPSPRLRAGRDGMQATVADCRRLEERSSELQRALKSFRGSEGVIQAVDLFGIRSAADLDELMNEATGYLSRFFDSHLIADADGLILFEAETATASEIEVDETRVEDPRLLALRGHLGTASRRVVGGRRRRNRRDRRRLDAGGGGDIVSRLVWITAGPPGSPPRGSNSLQGEMEDESLRRTATFVDTITFAAPQHIRPVQDRPRGVAD